MYPSNIRIKFNAVSEVLDIDNSLTFQISSYRNFFQSCAHPLEREKVGLEAIFRSSFPMVDANNNFLLNYCYYEINSSKFEPSECIDAGLSYVSSISVKFRLDILKEGKVIESREQVVPFIEVPMITDDGSFIINGVERAAVSQIHRSPGVVFSRENRDNNGYPEEYIVAKVSIVKGPWLDFEFDNKGSLRVKIDKTKKVPLAALLFSLYKNSSYFQFKKIAKNSSLIDEGYSSAEILAMFYKVFEFNLNKSGIWEADFDSDYFINRKFDIDLLDIDGNVIFPAGKRITAGLVKKLKPSRFGLASKSLWGKYIAKDYVDQDGNIILDAGAPIEEDSLSAIGNTALTLDLDLPNTNFCVRDAIYSSDVFDRASGLISLYRAIKGVLPSDIHEAEVVMYRTFFDPSYCSFSEVGRVKMNHRLGISETSLTYTVNDIVAIIRKIISIQVGDDFIDDIDSLYNRRIRSVAEILENTYRAGIARSQKYIRDRAQILDLDTIKPMDLVNFKQLSTAVKDFFHSSQLCQFLDNTNPLTSLTHKRRISAFGVGGVSRERAGFEIRDVHVTHYGRICPIETPEGQNIGLINSPATHAMINKHGFLEAPYRVVDNGKLTDKVIYLSALDEYKYSIAEFTRDVDRDGNIIADTVSARVVGEYKTISKFKVDLMDASCRQTVSIAASLIPFLENDDANRALMGSNMQRQAVPLMNPESPLVGTGVEKHVANSSSEIIASKHDGVVESVDGSNIVISYVKDGIIGLDIHSLKKFRGSNHNTCIHQSPCVKLGQSVKEGQHITQGLSFQDGELALGKNVLCAFIPWYGHNFEDSIVISERIVKDNSFASIHIEEFSAMSLDTKLGPEEITRDIPNYHGSYLDETGIISVGSYVTPGDILVGKVTPKGSETSLIAEERLLRAMFGEKARSVKDTSLRVPPGVYGSVIDVKVISYSDTDTDYRSYMVHEAFIKQIEVNVRKNLDTTRKAFESMISKEFTGKILNDNSVATEESLRSASLESLKALKFKDQDVQKSLEDNLYKFGLSIKAVEQQAKEQKERLQRGVEFPSNVLKVVKIFIAVKRRLQPGDKISGRHGNKGVISEIVPVEDMPYLEDGTPIDVVLNTLGVPSRMNIGQVLEAHLGWGVKKLGEKISNMVPDHYTPGMDITQSRNNVMKCLEMAFDSYNLQQIKDLEDQDFYDFVKKSKAGIKVASAIFDGATSQDIDRVLNAADTKAQMALINGRTGEKFHRPVTVGYSYLLKLDHLVDDKIHARSVGRYSLVTQQPLGGRAQFGGQRFGEMEVWALKAYGAAYTLHEMLTIKSDDSLGRVKAYDAIIRGNDNFISGSPESCNVLIKELQALGIGVDLFYDNKKGAN